MVKDSKEQGIAIVVNGEHAIVPESTTVEELLALRGLLMPNGIAVAVNNVVLRRQNWRVHELHAGDSVVLLTAVQGG